MTRWAVAFRGGPTWAAVALLLGLGCEPRDQTPVGRGARVFQRTCSGCHGADGRGVMRLGLSKPPRDLTNAEFHASVSDDDLRRVIRVGKNQMPAFGGLMGDDDLNNVIAFIRTLPPGARPQPPAVPGPAPAPPASSATPESPVPPSALATPPKEPDKTGVMQ